MVDLNPTSKRVPVQVRVRVPFKNRMYPKLECDRYFFDLYKKGTISVSDTGIVWDNVKNKLIKPFYTAGYARILHKGVGIQVHRLVYLVYKGEIPYKYAVNHEDGVKLNNSVTNLTLMTYGQNNLHAYRTGLKSHSEYQKKLSKERLTGENNLNAIFKDSDIIKIRTQYSRRETTVKKIANEYGIGQRSVKNMLIGITFSHINGAIKYATKVNREDVEKAKELIRQGYSVKKAAETVNIKRSTLRGYL